MELFHPGAYYERFNLNTTTAVLNDPARRATLVKALQAIAVASKRIGPDPTPWLPALSKAIATPETVIAQAWPQFKFPARLNGKDLVNVMASMEPVAAKIANRPARTEPLLERLVDESVVAAAGI